MKLIFFVNLTFWVFTLSAREPILNPLVDTAREMISLINRAKECEVSLSSNGASLRLCSGLTLDKTDLRFLKKLSLKTCKRNLRQAGNRVIEAKLNKRPSSIDAQLWSEFFSSTKLALIVYEQKLILFKNEAKRGDCIHETLHYYQRTRGSNSPLSPKKRKLKQEKLQSLLEEMIVVVEKYEKAGNKVKAQKLAQQLQPFISLQREWMNIGQWLDEKEIYQTFLDHSSLLSLTDRDRDIALANLLRLKDSLSWRLKERVIELGNQFLTKKYKSVKLPSAAEVSGLKSEKFYQEQFNSGLMTREDYEVNIIKIRKFKANIAFKTSKTLAQKLAAQGLKRAFKLLNDDGITKSVSFSFVIKDEFMQVKLGESWVVIDFGAQKSVLPKSLESKLSFNDVSLLNNQVLKTVGGRSKSSPYIQIHKGLKLGKMKKVKGIVGTLGSVGLKGVEGILGLDFFRLFNNGRWRVDFKKKRLAPAIGEVKGVKLEQGGRSFYDALEYICDKKIGVKVRLDSGSQVYGDINPLSKKRSKACFKDTSRFELLDANSLVFSRAVDINLGLPFLLDKVSTISFDLVQGSLNIDWKKK